MASLMIGLISISSAHPFEFASSNIKSCGQQKASSRQDSKLRHAAPGEARGPCMKDAPAFDSLSFPIRMGPGSWRAIQAEEKIDE